MGRRSSIKSLPEPVRAAIDAEIRADRLTLDEILDSVADTFGDQYGDEAVPSRAALGRYRKSERERMQDVIQAEDTARVWASELGNTPQSQMGKVLQQLLTTLAWKSTQKALDADDVPTDEIAKLARAYRAVEEAGQISDKRERELREQTLAEAEERVEALSDGARQPDTETLKLVRAAIRGEA
ncbi:phage protein Gp27 family protein [Salinisphaera orenii]|uniref:Small terminase subunit n=1 Tax=Salinisphaera orenii YIM 95161 TaxID=1051139 RepID=A0A423PRJ9_9GAMM|nr:phage protein Gp27 family protein [Salinisphaera halophila]ROO28235.1 small terminase subunit [Salinisphaera halophila YIM 95161]